MTNEQEARTMTARCPICGETIGLRNGAPIEAGAFSIHVPGGTYRVAAHLPAGSPYMSTGEREVTVAAGGSTAMTLTVKAKDAPALFARPEIDGGLIGGASLDPEQFKAIVGAAVDAALGK